MRVASYYLVAGIPLDREMDRLRALPVFAAGPLVAKRPQLRIRRAAKKPNRLGFAVPTEHRLSVTAYPGIGPGDVLETLLHELTHLHVGRAREAHAWHGPTFKRTLAQAMREAYGLEVPTPRSTLHGVYAEAIAAASPSLPRTDAELFERSVATLVHSWAYLASGSPGAAVVRGRGATIAAFVHDPDRQFLNNTLLSGAAAASGRTLDAVERVYAERGIDRFAIWVHEADADLAGAVEARGYRYDSSTRTMAMPIADLAEVDTSPLDLVEKPSPERFWRVDGPDGLLPQLAAEGAHFYVARCRGVSAATLMAFDHGGDCGIYMVGTTPAARRQGLATMLSAHAIAEARARGCTTVSLQSTPMAEGVYAGIGFRDLGRFHEYVPE
ncbi:MAG TPA: GNAT family N-acetyltransferase [Solirubrobacterales bacterium]|nr:GNAT family N-acetyltransferase [Solirubrobacterales bacterium]